jgi:hypothetical protein
MTTIRRRVSLPTLCLATLALASGIAIALGPLNPPAGAVSSSNRTLQEIFDKIPDGDGRVLIPGGTSTVTINQPGSYVLTGNITVSNIGINILNPGGSVTLDLNGFRVTSSSLTSPVIQVNNCPQVIVRNGSTSGGLSGVSLSIAPGALVEDVRVTGAKANGIIFNANASPGATVRRCVVVDTGVTTVAADTNNVFGISTGSLNHGTRFEDCTVTRLFHNGTSPGSITGILNFSTGGSVSRCLVANISTITGSTGVNLNSTVVYSGNNVVNFPVATEYVGGTDGGGNF